MGNKLNFINRLRLKYRLNYDTLLKAINGDLVILGMKKTGKTTLLMNLARSLRMNPMNHVIIFETFPKWIHEFDSIPYFIITDRDIVKDGKDYTIKNELELAKTLKENKDIIFLIECLDMEKISMIMSFIIYLVYKKQYGRAKKNQLESVGENYWFLTEEAHNLLDSTVIVKKIFNKLRKMHNEFRNLRIHLICVTLRLQDLSPKIRAKMDIILGRVSLDDYQLKIRNLLRDSKYRREVTRLPIGIFAYPESDLLLHSEPFKQVGKPHKVSRNIEE